MLKKRLRNKKGFTLIEIIAVLVILGILAAVAIPKFMGLQDDARNAAGLGGLGAAAGNVQVAYAKMLAAGSNPTQGTLLTKLGGTGNYTNVGDFTVSYSTSGSDSILITLTAGKYGTPTTKVVRVFN